MALTKLVDNDLWVSQGQHNGEEASVAAAQKELAQSLALYHNTSINNPAHIQFTAFLCANHLTEASYTTDSRVVQKVRDALTIETAKKHVQSMLVATQQHDSSAIKAATNSFVQSLWTKDSVKIFLPWFVPLRM
ncbi:MAG: hypothetical protein ACRDHW_10120 [Ktedonobacteraceae bacterium]